MAACTTPEAAEPGLRGRVMDTNGQVVAGALVTALYDSLGVEVTVGTDADGQYVVPLDFGPAPQLRVQHFGFDAQVVSAPGDVVLEATADGYAQAPSSAFWGLLPDGVEKRQFMLDCGGCHQFNRAIIETDGTWKSEGLWHERIAQMIGFAGGNSGFPIMAPSRDADATTAWLMQHLGQPGDPRPELDLAPLRTNDADEVVITEYTLPVPQDLPHDLMVDANGEVLITGMMTHLMYTLDPASGRFDTTGIPVQFANPRALDLADDGSWWVLLGYPRQIAHYQPATGGWRSFDIGMYPHSIVHDEARGRVWFNGHFTKSPELIGYVDTESGEVKTYDVPTEAMPDGGSTIPYGLRIDQQGTLWATQLVGGRLIKFEPETEAFTLYDLPTPFSGPRRPAIAPNGAVWIPEFSAGKLAHFDPQTERFTEYDLPIPDALPYIARVDPRDGSVWIATAAADAVLRFDPQSRNFAVYPLPTPASLVRHMDLAANGDVWIAYGNSPAVTPKIARLQRRE